MVISPKRMDIITKFIKMNHICLLYSPPSSGKYTLEQYLKEYFCNYNHNSIYISLIGIYNTQTMNDEILFDDFWNNEMGLSWKEISNCGSATCVIIN